MILRGDARSIPLRDGSVNCVVTSPPYWGLRDYGVAGQIGLERTPEEYVATMVAVFREVRRVLRDDGTLWLVIGDSYAGSGRGGNPDAGTKQGTNAGSQSVGVLYGREDSGKEERARIRAQFDAERAAGLKPKDLVGIPWRVAFALQADGWYLRSDIIWSKPNPMPESVTDRPTKAHEYLFLMAKSERYFYDAEAIKEPAATDDERPPHGRGQMGRPSAGARNPYAGKELKSNKPGWSGNPNVRGEKGHPLPGAWQDGGGRNRRTVWTVATQPYSGAHFATFPEKLIEPCILAGCPKGGIVFDPFGGSGTTVRVARRLQRKGVALELNPEYIALARKRIAGVQTELVA